MLNADAKERVFAATNPAGRAISPGESIAGSVGSEVNATVRGRVWYNLLDAPVLILDVTV